MCGRATFTNPEAIRAAMALLAAEEDAAIAAMPPRYNIAPSQQLPIVLERDGRRFARLARWGLIPHWASDPKIGNKMINARAETAHEKPAFRDAVRSHRCLVAVDGFYEWRRPDEGAKQPFAIRMHDSEPFFIAGLWSRWRDKGQPESGLLLTCTVLTTTANDVMSPIHDRMPVIIAASDAPAWLDRETPIDEVRALLHSPPIERMEAYPVSPLVNAPANDLPSCLDAIELDADRL